MRFPIEIMVMIYQNLLKLVGIRCKARWTILCSCKTLYEALGLMLWQHVVLNNQALLKFVTDDTLCNSQLIKSLALRFDRSSAFINSIHPTSAALRDCTEMREDNKLCQRHAIMAFQDALRKLPKMVEKFTNLETFSLHVSAKPYSDPVSQFYIDSETLNLLAYALPKTVRAVEIDTCGFDHTADNPPASPQDVCKPVPLYHCICRSYAQLAKRTEVLRISVREICWRFFVPSTTLKHCVINMTCEDLMVATWCRYGTCSCRHDLTHGASHRESNERIVPDMPDWIQTMRGSSWKAGRYPQLKRFHVISARSRLLKDTGHLCLSLMTHDMLGMTTKAMPCWAINTTDHRNSLFTLRTHIDEEIGAAYDVTGYYKDILQYLEDDFWVENEEGSRYPRLDETVLHRSRRKWIEPQLLSPDQVEGESYVWKEENLAQKLLLQPCTPFFGTVVSYPVPPSTGL